jgi:signal transduction histidine kinase
MKDFKLIRKKLLFCIISLFFITCFNSSILAGNEADKEEMDLTGPETALQNAMDELFNLVDTIEKEKSLSQKEKTEKIFNSIKNARWGPEQDNYFWVIDLNGNMVGEPVCVDLEGKSVINYNIIDYKDDPEGKKLFDDVIKKCNEKGQTFFQYLMPECKREPADLKVALARLLIYKKWIIITGIYRDTIEAYQAPIETNFFVPADDISPIDDSQPASGT